MIQFYPDIDLLASVYQDGPHSPWRSHWFWDPIMVADQPAAIDNFTVETICELIVGLSPSQGIEILVQSKADPCTKARAVAEAVVKNLAG
jgi:hypothetical protein